MAHLVKAAREDLQQWDLQLRAEKAEAKVRHRALIDGGGNKGWEGRKVGIDFFFRNPRGPPHDLRKDKDEFPGRYGLAAEYMGNRELVNPFEWNCVWEEMGIPFETRRALEREEKAGVGGRVVRDNGVYPAAQGDARQKEAEDSKCSHRFVPCFFILCFICCSEVSVPKRLHPFLALFLLVFCNCPFCTCLFSLNRLLNLFSYVSSAPF